MFRQRQKIQTISADGQIAIPLEYRELLGFFPNRKIAIDIEPRARRLILQSTSDLVDELYGVLKGKLARAGDIKKNIRNEEKIYE